MKCWLSNSTQLLRNTCWKNSLPNGTKILLLRNGTVGNKNNNPNSEPNNLSGEKNKQQDLEFKFSNIQKTFMTDCIRAT